MSLFQLQFPTIEILAIERPPLFHLTNFIQAFLKEKKCVTLLTDTLSLHQFFCNGVKNIFFSVPERPLCNTITWQSCWRDVTVHKKAQDFWGQKKLELLKMLRDFLSCCTAKSCIVFGKILISANKFGKRLLLKRQQRKRQRKRRRLLSRRRCSFCLARRESPRLRLPAQGMPTVGNVVFISKQNWFKLQDRISITAGQKWWATFLAKWAYFISISHENGYHFLNLRQNSQTLRAK